jgi:hypothetical protein
MSTNTIVMSIVLVVLIALIAISFYLGDRQAKKDTENERIISIQRHIKEDLETIPIYATRYGDKFYDALMDFANKMEKLSDSDVRADLKPYDVYNMKTLSEYLKSMGKLLGRIVIDKNLEPRFMTSYLSTNTEEADIELEAALTIGEVKELAEKCRKIKMEVDIETYRKEKVKKALNG